MGEASRRIEGWIDAVSVSRHPHSTPLTDGAIDDENRPAPPVAGDLLDLTPRPALARPTARGRRRRPKRRWGSSTSPSSSTPSRRTPTRTATRRPGTASYARLCSGSSSPPPRAPRARHAGPDREARASERRKVDYVLAMDVPPAARLQQPTRIRPRMEADREGTARTREHGVYWRLLGYPRYNWLIQKCRHPHSSCRYGLSIDFWRLSSRSCWSCGRP